MSEPTGCKCARIAYRNNRDGTRDYTVLGDSRCPICRGSGFCDTCSWCEGAGIFDSEICLQCRGNGKVRVERPSMPWVTR